MKYIIYILLIFVCFPNISEAGNKKGELPPNAIQFINRHFPKNEIVKSKSDKDGFEADLRSGHEIEFDSNGNWIKIKGEYTPMPKSIIDLLPIGISQYISKNYPRRAIIKIKKKKYGYNVELASSVELKFGHKGEFIGKD